MNTRTQIILPVIAASLLLLLAGCGGNDYSQIQTAGVSATGVVPTGTNVVGSGVTASTGSFTFGTNTSGVVGSTGSDSPPYEYSFSVTGAGGTNPTYTTSVDTDNLLNVAIAAGQAGQLSLPNGQYSNYTASYGCVSFSLTVLGQTVITDPLSVGNGSPWCNPEETYQVFNFSNRITPGQQQSIPIEVQANGYDFYCQECYQNLLSEYVYTGGFTTSCNTYCPQYGVYRTHTVTGMLEIQVNGTSL